MSAFIEKIQISNFLSFFGKYEVNLKTFSAIMCNFYEGRDDLCRAFEFVFGATLADLRVENPLDLVHKVLREEFLVNRDIHTYVEITLGQKQDKKQLKFSRSVKNGVNNARIEHKISDLITSSLLYEEKLESLGIFTRQKNLIFYKSYFNNVIWGSAEDLEMTICTCLRESYLLENWEKTNKEVEHLKKLKNRAAEKHYTSMKTSHSVLAKYTKKYKTFLKNRELSVGEILDVTNDSSTESNLFVADYAKDTSLDDFKEREQDRFKLETDIHFLTEKLDELKLKEALLTSHLYHEEIKLASKPVNASILQNRITHIKTLIQEKENLILEIWKEIQVIKSDLDDINRKIPFMLLAVQEIQTRNDHQNRFTQYGKFCDYLQPSRYIHLLKHIIGADIFNAHLCDSAEEAIFLLKQLKDLKYELREVFLPFEHYSHKLKDIITASGEKGIQINTLEELLIFLCKLKHYHLIDEVPVIVKRDFNFDVLPEEFTIYVRNNIYFTSEGLFSCRTEENDFSLETENELRENLQKFYIEEEINYQKWNDLLFMKWETLINLNSLENDILCLKQKWRKSTQKPPAIRESSPVTQIYEEFRDIFKEYEEKREEYETEIQQQEEEPFFEERSYSTSSNEESVSFFINNLEDVKIEKTKTETKLQDLTQELRRLNAVTYLTAAYDCNMVRNFIKFQNNVDKTKLFFEKEFKKLKNLIREDDLEDFLGSEEWRKTFIGSLIKDFDIIKCKLKTASEELLYISKERKTKLYQLFDHCSRYLSNTFSHILNDALPFIKIDFGFGEEKVHLLSCLGEDKINVVDIKHFNTFLNFISALALFLELAIFEKIPLMIIEDIEEYFPIQNDNLEAVLELNTLEKILPDNENPRFSLLMRLGQFLQYYIKKNTPGKFVRNNGSNTGHINGPMQMIYFVNGDLIHSAEHVIWIQSQVLPEEHITENCNSYSKIHEVNFENLNN